MQLTRMTSEAEILLTCMLALTSSGEAMNGDWNRCSMNSKDNNNLSKNNRYSLSKGNNKNKNIK